MGNRQSRELEQVAPDLDTAVAEQESGFGHAMEVNEVGFNPLATGNFKCNTNNTTSNIHGNESSWSEYIRMFNNIGWSDPPDRNDAKYSTLIDEIRQATNDTPSRIRTKEQFIDIITESTIISNELREEIMNELNRQRAHNEGQQITDSCLQCLIL